MGRNKIKIIVWKLRNKLLGIPNVKISEMPDYSQGTIELIVILHCFHALSSYYALDALQRLPEIEHIILTSEDSLLLSQMSSRATNMRTIRKVTTLLTGKGEKDTSAFVSTLTKLEIAESGIYLKLHGKSCQTAARQRWAFRCIDETIPKNPDCMKILGFLSQQTKPSAVVPLSSVAGIETNFKFLRSLRKISGITFREGLRNIYPAGSMFWANGTFLNGFKRSFEMWNTEQLRCDHRSPEIIERLLFTDFDEQNSITVYQAEYGLPLHTLNK